MIRFISSSKLVQLYGAYTKSYYATQPKELLQSVGQKALGVVNLDEFLANKKSSDEVSEEKWQRSAIHQSGQVLDGKQDSCVTRRYSKLERHTPSPGIHVGQSKKLVLFHQIC